MPGRINDYTNSILNGYLSATGRTELNGLIGMEEYLLLRNQAIKEISMGFSAESSTVIGAQNKPTVSQGNTSPVNPELTVPTQPVQPVQQKSVNGNASSTSKTVNNNINEKKVPQKPKTAAQRFVERCKAMED